jgi:hypothetical protein
MLARLAEWDGAREDDGRPAPCNERVRSAEFKLELSAAQLQRVDWAAGALTGSAALSNDCE